MTDDTNNLHAAALVYAELGYAIFPCRPGTKKPLTKHGFKDATTDAEQITCWWTDCPSANIAIATEGLLVLDVDGVQNPWLADDPEKQLDLARGPVQITPGGGRQFFFRQPTGKRWRCTTGKVAIRVDTRADGGYAVVPPSVRPDGKYCWVETMALDCSPADLPEPPDWLATILDTLATGAATLARVASGAPEANTIPSGQRNATLASLGGTMRRAGMSQAEILAALKQANTDRCQPPLGDREVERIAASIARYEPDQVTVALVENHWEQDAAPPTPAAPADPGPFPAEFIHRCPELVSRVLEYHHAWSVEVQPTLMLASLVAATGCVLGHKVQDRTGLRTNIYVVGITGTGGGKEPTRETVRRIFAQAGLESMCGPEDFASDTGLIAAVEQQNPILFQIDEFGRLMQCINVGPARNPHLYNIASVLLKFFGKASSVFRSKAYADPKRNRVIVNPHVCLYGTTVRDNFWRAMNSDSLEGGFLPRVLLFESREESLEGAACDHDVPEEVAKFFTEWAARRVASGNLVSAHPAPMVVPYSDVAWSTMADFRAEQKEQQRAGGIAGALWSRARENAGKLALIHACWKETPEPRVEADSAAWAIDVTRHSVQLTIHQAHLCMADSPFEERCQKILQVIHAAPGHRMAKHAITRATRSMTPRERDEALESLVEEGSLRDVSIPTRGRKRLEFQAV